MAISASAGAGSAAAVARALAPHAVIEQNLERCTSAQQVCAELSRIFNVGVTEVALMRVEGDILNFVFPTELQPQASCHFRAPRQLRRVRPARAKSSFSIIS